METTKPTRLEAFKTAQQTGQIAVTPATAAIFKELTLIEESEGRIIEALATYYPDEQDKMAAAIYAQHNQLQDVIIKSWVDYVLHCNAFENTYFEGL